MATRAEKRLTTARDLTESGPFSCADVAAAVQPVKEGMLVIVVIVIITVVVLISVDRVSSRQTTNGRSLKAAEDRFLNRFLHRRSQRRQRDVRSALSRYHSWCLARDHCQRRTIRPT